MYSVEIDVLKETKEKIQFDNWMRDDYSRGACHWKDREWRETEIFENTTFSLVL